VCWCGTAVKCADVVGVYWQVHAHTAVVVLWRSGMSACRLTGAVNRGQVSAGMCRYVNIVTTVRLNMKFVITKAQVNQHLSCDCLVHQRQINVNRSLLYCVPQLYVCTLLVNSFYCYSSIWYDLLLCNTCFSVSRTTQYWILQSRWFLAIKIIWAKFCSMQLVKYDTYITRKILLYATKFSSYYFTC